MVPNGVDAIINGDVTSMGQLEHVAPAVTKWLINSLPLASEDATLKNRLKLVLGCEFYISNLQHLGLWDDLIKSCSAHALEMGKAMQAYYLVMQLREELGCSCPNVFGKVVRRIHKGKRRKKIRVRYPSIHLFI